jgi:hypothetical protein
MEVTTLLIGQPVGAPTVRYINNYYRLVFLKILLQNITQDYHWAREENYSGLLFVRKSARGG